jgi:hypothetical protein
MIFDDRQITLVYVVIVSLIFLGFYLIAFVFFFTCWDLYEGEDELEDPDISYSNEDYFGAPDYDSHLERLPYRYDTTVKESYRENFRYFYNSNAINSVYDNRCFMQYSYSNFEYGVDHSIIFFRSYHANPMYYRFIRRTNKTILFSPKFLEKPISYRFKKDIQLWKKMRSNCTTSGYFN